MKRAASLTGNIIFYLIIVSILFSVGSQQFMGRAWGWSMVSGDSMTPTMGSGDLAFVAPPLGWQVEPA